MKTNRFILGILTSLLFVTCTEQKPTVAPIVIDLPVSYKADTAAYRFITQYTKEWNAFGKKIESMYKEGEKWRKKDFATLTEKEQRKVIKLDLDYAREWMVQRLFIDLMMLDLEMVKDRCTMQGTAKISESQILISDYIKLLVLTFGDDLKLDPEPYVFSQEENERWAAYIDSVTKAQSDTTQTAIPPVSEWGK
ncbi:MAG: hypothetical protein LBC84_01860 [Prevotellaceae bacterium]|jgi:hypothetical protein|nr:hypothetical protein [Prevotellaceae bacterium]